MCILILYLLIPRTYYTFKNIIRFSDVHTTWYHDEMKNIQAFSPFNISAKLFTLEILGENNYAKSEDLKKKIVGMAEQ